MNLDLEKVTSSEQLFQLCLLMHLRPLFDKNNLELLEKFEFR